MRLPNAIPNLILTATILAVAIYCRWSAYEFALLVVYDIALITLLALLLRPLQALLTLFDLARGGITPSIGTLLFAFGCFFLMAIAVGMTMGLQAISHLPARSDALAIDTAWSGMAQGIVIAVAARALQLLEAVRKGFAPPHFRSALAAATGTAVLLTMTLLSMLVDDLAASTPLTVLCLLIWQGGGWLALRR